MRNPMWLWQMSLGAKMALMWLYCLMVTISFVVCLREVGAHGWPVYAIGLCISLWTNYLFWFSLIRGFHR